MSLDARGRNHPLTAFLLLLPVPCVGERAIVRPSRALALARGSQAKPSAVTTVPGIAPGDFAPNWFGERSMFMFGTVTRRWR